MECQKAGEKALCRSKVQMRRFSTLYSKRYSHHALLTSG